MHEPQGFREFVEGRSAELVSSAWLLCGDRHAAHDLVQTALMKTWPRWEHLARRDRPELYVHRVMLTTYLAWRSRRWNSERPYATLPDVERPDGEIASTELRQALLDALRGLAPRQRAVIVLRYFEDLTEAEAAEALGCSVGTVKTHASRAMAHLREVPGLAALLDLEVS